MKVDKRGRVLLAMSDSCDMDGRSIFIDDQISGVSTTVFLQTLQTDDSSKASGKLPTIVKSVFANSDILAMIFGGIMRMNGLWIRFIFCLSSDRFISSLARAFANSKQDSQVELSEHDSEMLTSTPCRSSTVTPQYLQIIRF